MAITVNGTPGISASGVATLTNKTLDAPIINNATFTGQQAGLQVAFNDSIVFEGTTADAYETTLSAGEPTADRTITLPNATDTLVGKATTDTLTNKTINGSNNTISNIDISTAVSGLGSNVATFLATPSSANLINAVTDETGSGALVFANTPTLITPVLGTPTSGTLTNCTGLPVSGISSSTTTALGVGSVELGHASDTTLARVSAGVVSIEGVNVVTTSSTDTLTNKTLTSPTINGAFTNSVNEIIVRGLEEDVNVVASAATGTINFDVATASIWYYTSNATANHTLNFRYNSGNSLSSKLAVGDAITVVWMNTNGSTAYYPNTIQIDGSAVTPKVPAAISAGNASAIDVYSFTIIKTAATPTYTVLETQTKFA